MEAVNTGRGCEVDIQNCVDPELVVHNRRSTDLLVHDVDMFHVALVQLPPVYEYGLTMVLSAAGIGSSAPATPEECQGLLPGRGPLVVVVDTARDIALWLPTPSEGMIRLVHVVPAITVRTCEAALNAGATGVVALDAEPRSAIAVLRAAAEGKSILPTTVAREMCRPQVGPRPQLERPEIDWLRSLADGATVMTVARAHGYSERELYRRLAGVYRRLGAASRTDALLIAERFGLLAAEPG